MAAYDAEFEFFTARKVWLRLDVGIKKKQIKHTPILIRFRITKFQKMMDSLFKTD